MNVFPIGEVAASSQGRINNILYSMFEPNKSARSEVTHSILTTRYDNQTLLTRKKADPYLIIYYEYENIFTKEFRQIESFIDSIGEGGLNSFYVIDFSRIQTPSNATIVAGDWMFNIDDTRFFSATVHQKSNEVFAWSGTKFKIGTISAISRNASITMTVTASSGNLTMPNMLSRGVIYPMYQAYSQSRALTNFKSSDIFIPKDINTESVGGYMYTGNISFSTRYKV